MISVMNSNDCELDRGSDVIQEPHARPRVSDDGGASSSDRVAHGGTDVESCVNLAMSEEAGSFSQLESEANTGPDVRVLDGRGGLNAESVKSEIGGSGKVRFCDESDGRGVDKGMESRVFEDKLEDLDSRESVYRFDDRNDGMKGKEGEWTGDAFDSQNDRKEEMALGAEMDKSAVSQYESLLSKFDDYVANEKRETMDMGILNAVGYGFEVGDMVWGKVKSHPWWPGHIFNEAFASPSVRRMRREGHVLVAFFGDSSYGWFDPAELIHFGPHYADKSRQTTSRNFVKAVEEAVDEASRRCGLGLACRCRNPYNFRPTNVQGYFAVDVPDYEPGGIYSGIQIGKARESFESGEALAFIKQLATTPRSSEQRSIDWIKNRATVLAYRKAVYEEFDETYAQAFGMQPVRPSHEPTGVLDLHFKEPSRAPLSGPLVIAEALGGGKNSTKPVKIKDQSKKDRYLFKRRDEPSNSKTHQISQGHASSSAQPAFVEGSSTLAAGDYVFQKRALAASIKPQITAKDEQIEDINRDGAAVSIGDAIAKEAFNLDKRPLMADSQANTSKVDSSTSSAISFPMDCASASPGSSFIANPPLDRGKGPLLESDQSVATDPMATSRSDLSGELAFPSATDSLPHIFQQQGDLKYESSRALKVGEGFQQSNQSFPMRVEECHGPNNVQDSRSGAQPLPNNVKLPNQDLRITDGGLKKAKVLKRPAGDFGSGKSILGEKKRKRKKEFGLETGSVHHKKHPVAGKGGAVIGKLSRKLNQTGFAPREDYQADHKKEGAGGFFSDSVGMLPLVGMGNIELELSQLLGDLQALALDPFHGVDRKSPAIIRQFFLRFRSLVYQKSLVLSPSGETEPSEVRVPKPPVALGASDNPASENVRDLPSMKPPKLPFRSDDPTKAGRKRGPSDRQEEIAAKKLKKIIDLKSLAAEKKASLKPPAAQRGEGKETAASAPPKPAKPDSIKKMERPAKAADPTMLVMKFPPRTSLPSIPELKARFARFGQLDHTGTRVFWKTFTCRVVFMHKVDAQAAYKYAIGNNSLFGNVSVRFNLREVNVPAPDLPESGKGRAEDTSNDALQPRDSATEQRLPSAFLHQPTQQPAVQLKSCLKKSTDETGGGGGRGTPRVKFMLGGEENSCGEQLMVGNRNNFNNNASFADGGASSSSSVAMDFNSKNFQKLLPPSPQPILPFPQFPKAPNNLNHTEASLRITHNYNLPNAQPSAPGIDISQQMLSLLARCNDVVTNLKGFLGYVPYHPL